MNWLPGEAPGPAERTKENRRQPHGSVVFDSMDRVDQEWTWRVKGRRTPSYDDRKVPRQRCMNGSQVPTAVASVSRVWLCSHLTEL